MKTIKNLFLLAKILLMLIVGIIVGAVIFGVGAKIQKNWNIRHHQPLGAWAQAAEDAARLAEQDRKSYDNTDPFK